MAHGWDDEVLDAAGVESQEDGTLRLEGRRLEVSLSISPWTSLARVEFAPPLDLGLKVFRRGAFTGPSVEVDPGLWVGADEPARARALLGKRVLGSLRWLAQVASIEMDDAAIAVGISAPGADPRKLQRTSLQHLSRVAGAVDGRRSGCPAPTVLAAQAPAWQALGAGLAVSHTPLRAEGTVGDLAVHARTVRTGERQHAFEVLVVRPAPLGIDLCIERQTALGRLAAPFRSGDARDRKVGDAFFDRWFDVRCRDEGAGIVDEDVVDAILECVRGAEEVRFDDHGARLAGRCDPLHTGGVPALVRAGCRAVARLDENLARARGRPAGPYR